MFETYRTPCLMTLVSYVTKPHRLCSHTAFSDWKLVDFHFKLCKKNVHCIVRGLYLVESIVISRHQHVYYGKNHECRLECWQQSFSNFRNIAVKVDGWRGRSHIRTYWWSLLADFVYYMYLDQYL